MSTLHPQQFHQLAMFLPVDEVIDTFDKGDTYFRHGDTSPRDQWVKPALETTLTNKQGEALRDRKLRQIEEQRGSPTNRHESMVYDLEHGRRMGTLPPVDVDVPHDGAMETGRPLLVNGHHRLALLEKRQRETGHQQFLPLRWY